LDAGFFGGWQTPASRERSDETPSTDQRRMTPFRTEMEIEIERDL